MDDIHPSDLKAILHSKRANLYYLEHCRVLVNGGRVEYVTDEGKRSLYWNIPIANTTCVLLGTGTSVTQAAMREDVTALSALLSRSGSNIQVASDHTALLMEEARLTKDLYKLAARATQYGYFVRGKRGQGTDAANQFLDHGNYLVLSVTLFHENSSE